MFYNVFLPGGIGGDVYKTTVINKRHSNGLKVSSGAVIVDRLSGVVILVTFAFVLLPFVEKKEIFSLITLLGITGLLAGFFLFIKILTPMIKKITWSLLAYSFFVQSLQLLSVIFILYSFDIHGNHPEYLLIFLVSSVAAMLPISIGGMGIREIVFLYGAGYFQIDSQYAVSISFMFYIISVAASLFGVVPALEKQQHNKIAE